MKLNNTLAKWLAKIKPAFEWLKSSQQAESSITQRIKSAFKAFRERKRRIPENDVSHLFLAKSYPGSRDRQYVVHIPRGKIGQHPRPLVVVLHGCKQDHRDIEHISGFNRLSDKHGFLITYPFVTSYRGLRNQNCWGWWFKREIQAGAGEAEDLWQIVEEIKQNYLVDAQRIHVAGLSSGAGMAVAMMVAHANKIASGAAVAGIPYSEKAEAVRHIFNIFPRNKKITDVVRAMKKEMGNNLRAVPLKVIHSNNDHTVRIQSAFNLRDSWGLCFDVDTDESYKVTNGSIGDTDWEHNRYRIGEGPSVIETLFLNGPGHGWYGGNPGQYSYPQAPDISKSIWKFFSTHQLPDDLIT